MRAELGGDLPAGLERLSDDERADLAAAIADVRRAQGEALDEAIDQALRDVPRLLRGTAKKVLLG